MGNTTSCGDDASPLRSGQKVFIVAASDHEHVDVGFGEVDHNGCYEYDATVHLRAILPASGTAVGSGSQSGAELHVGDFVQVVQPTFSQQGKHRCGTLGPVPLLLPFPLRHSVPGACSMWSSVGLGALLGLGGATAHARAALGQTDRGGGSEHQM